MTSKSEAIDALLAAAESAETRAELVMHLSAAMVLLGRPAVCRAWRAAFGRARLSPACRWTADNPQVLLQ